MKLTKAITGISIFCFFIWASSTQFIGCTKKDYIHDTTTVHVHDTTTVHDTTYDLQTGLVAWYTFNGGSLNDGSSFHNNIVNNGATATTDRFGNANNAYSFNGSGNYMRVANKSSLNPTGGITMMAIIKINGFYSGNCKSNQVLGKGWPDNVNGWYALRFQDATNNCTSPVDLNSMFFSAAYGDNNPQGTAAGAGADTVILKTGQWYNMIVTYDGVQGKIYVNGVLKNSLTKSYTFTPNNFDLLIGKHEDPTFPYYFNGVIDEIRIYNRALPQGAVTMLNKLTQ